MKLFTSVVNNTVDWYNGTGINNTSMVNESTPFVAALSSASSDVLHTLINALNLTNDEFNEVLTENNLYIQNNNTLCTEPCIEPETMVVPLSCRSVKGFTGFTDCIGDFFGQLTTTLIAANAVLAATCIVLTSAVWAFGIWCCCRRRD